MINFQKVRTVFVKEWRDSLRDRRTIFATIAVPVMMWPILTLFMSEAAHQAKKKMAAEEYVVAVYPQQFEKYFNQALKAVTDEAERKASSAKISKKLEKAEGAAEALPQSSDVSKLFVTFVSDPHLALKEGRIDAVLTVPNNFGKYLKGEDLEAVSLKDVPELEILYDRAERRSQIAVGLLGEGLRRIQAQLREQRLARKGLSEGYLTAFRIAAEKNVAPAAKVSGSRLGSILPALFILMAITGALTPAIDLTAGEKERSTLETLIAAPVQPLDVITGKFLTVAALAMLNAVLNVSSFALTYSAVGPAKLALQVPWSTLPATFLLLIPLTLFFSGLLVAVCSFASNYKEAQVYVLPIYIIPMLGLVMVIIPGIELSGPLLILPVVNTSLLIKELFLGHEGLLEAYVFVFVSTCFYAAAAVAFAARVFAREEVLFASQGSLKLFLNRRSFVPQSLPRPADSLLVVALLFPANFYFSLLLTKVVAAGDGTFSSGSLAMLVILPQVVIFLGLPILAAWYLKLDRPKTFLWNWPRPRALLAGLLMGASSWIIALQFFYWQNLVWEFPRDPQFAQLEQVLRNLPPVVVVVLIALTPAICEEHVFRGFLLSGLRREKGKVWAVLLTAAIFAAFHLPLARQPLVFLLGMVIAHLAWESRCLWPGVLFHFLHNGLSALCAGYVMPAESADPVAAIYAPHMEYVIGAVILFGIGFLLSRNCGPVERPPEAMGAPAAQY